jgi:hypothetical protein
MQEFQRLINQVAALMNTFRAYSIQYWLWNNSTADRQNDGVLTIYKYERNDITILRHLSHDTSDICLAPQGILKRNAKSFDTASFNSYFNLGHFD